MHRLIVGTATAGLGTYGIYKVNVINQERVINLFICICIKYTLRKYNNYFRPKIFTLGV